MKSILMSVLTFGFILLLVSCAMMSKTPLSCGEVRLLSMDPLGAGVEANISFAMNVFFDSSGNPNIKKVCFYESGEEPLCFDAPNISYLTLGNKSAFQIWFPALRAGFHWVECYVEYNRDGQTVKSNVISTGITPKVRVGG